MISPLERDEFDVLSPYGASQPLRMPEWDDRVLGAMHQKRGAWQQPRKRVDGTDVVVAVPKPYSVHQVYGHGKTTRGRCHASRCAATASIIEAYSQNPKDGSHDGIDYGLEC